MAFDDNFDDGNSLGENVTIVDGSDGSKQTSVYNSDVQTADVLRTQGTNDVVSISTSATEAKVGGSKLTNRKLLVIQPLDNNLYWGFRSDVSTSNGFPLLKNQILTLSIDDATAVYLISGSGSIDVAIGES